MYAPTLRTRQTVEEIRASMAEALGPDGDAYLLEVSEEQAIRNPDLYVAGQRVEMVSTAETLAEQLCAPPVDPETLSEHHFFREFWKSPDRIGYWVRHLDPPGEDGGGGPAPDDLRHELAGQAGEQTGPLRTLNPFSRAAGDLTLLHGRGPRRAGIPRAHRPDLVREWVVGASVPRTSNVTFRY